MVLSHLQNFNCFISILYFDQSVCIYLNISQHNYTLFFVCSIFTFQTVPEGSRLTAAQKNRNLELMLGQIANFCPGIARNTFLKDATSLYDVWQKIILHLGFQCTGTHSWIWQISDWNPMSAQKPYTSASMHSSRIICWLPRLVFHIMAPLLLLKKTWTPLLKTQ